MSFYKGSPKITVFASLPLPPYSIIFANFARCFFLFGRILTTTFFLVKYYITTIYEIASSSLFELLVHGTLIRTEIPSFDCKIKKRIEFFSRFVKSFTLKKIGISLTKYFLNRFYAVIRWMIRENLSQLDPLQEVADTTVWLACSTRSTGIYCGFIETD